MLSKREVVGVPKLMSHLCNLEPRFFVFAVFVRIDSFLRPPMRRIGAFIVIRAEKMRYSPVDLGTRANSSAHISSYAMP